ncbi:MAG: prolipoprotein diacylglyceryl transferase [Myxococcota bacterium]
MLPELIRIPLLNLPIYTFGFLVAAGFLLAVHISYRQALHQGHFDQEVLDFSFWALLGGIIGGRIVFMLVEWKTFFVTEPWLYISGLGIWIPRFLALWQGGSVYWGNFFGGLVAFWWFCKHHKLPVFAFADVMVLGVPLAQAIGRLGCLAAGCCFGKHVYHLNEAGGVVADFPISLRFPQGSIAYSNLIHSMPQPAVQLMQTLESTLPLFPSQLAESIGCVGLFCLLLYVSPRRRFYGQVFFTYMISYSCLRSILELFRGDKARGFLIEGLLSTSQFISLCVVILSIAGWLAISRWTQHQLNKAS